jgi:hypothetical protein
MLPKEKQLKFSAILEADSFYNIIEVMIEKESLAFFYQSIDKIAEYSETKLNLKWLEVQKRTMIVASILVAKSFFHPPSP